MIENRCDSETWPMRKAVETKLDVAKMDAEIDDGG